MISEIGTAIATLKGMSDLTSLILKSKVDSAVTEKAIGLQTSIISLQSTLMTIQNENQELLHEKNELTQKLSEIEKWNAEAEGYKLTEITSGVFVYVANSQGDDPVHWLCPNCYGDRRKSMLQSEGTGIEGTDYSCPKCKMIIHDPTKRVSISFASSGRHSNTSGF